MASLAEAEWEYLYEEAKMARHYPGDIGDGRTLTIQITGEGIIMDVYEPGFRNIDEDKHIGTVGMMFDEWADWIVGGDFDDREERG
jgi:hypothetical protein